MDELLRWTGGELTPGPPSDRPVLVADSWLVQDGHARALEMHRARFIGACADIGLSGVEAFWAAAIARLPREGELFPRVEVDDQRQLRLRVRPAPPRGADIRVWAPGLPDVRQQPRTKGPDLPRLGELRTAAIAVGADDALLTTVDGLVLESGTASLLWWDDDRLLVPDPQLPVLPGVTARLIREAAARDGVDVVPVRCHLDDLASREAWLVNALHGIRPVVDWIGADVPAGPPERAPRWQQWWQELAQPCPS